MRYIRFKDGGLVVFSDEISLSKMARLLDKEVISSGYVSINCDNIVYCYGNKGFVKEYDTEYLNDQLRS